MSTQAVLEYLLPTRYRPTAWKIVLCGTILFLKLPFVLFCFSPWVYGSRPLLAAVYLSALVVVVGEVVRIFRFGRKNGLLEWFWRRSLFLWLEAFYISLYTFFDAWNSVASIIVISFAVLEFLPWKRFWKIRMALQLPFVFLHIYWIFILMLGPVFGLQQ